MFTCCKRQRPVVEQPFQLDLSPELQSIDSLLQQRPDSALMRLIEFQPADHYRSLLLSEALYKTDNTQQNRDDLLAAMCYFDSLAAQHPDNDDLTLLSARSHYMNGVGYYEADSIVDACREYLHTLEIMEGHFNEEDLVGYKAKFLGLTYTRLGSTLFYHITAQASIDSYKKAAYYFSKIYYSGLANTYRCIGNSYKLDNNNDSALVYFRKALVLARKQNIISAQFWTLTQAAPLYYDLGYRDSAFIMIKQAMILDTNEDSHLTCYYVYGSLLSSECQYDSAIYYLKKSLERNSFATQTVSAELIAKCYQALGDTVNMLYYKNLYGEKLDDYRSMITTVYNLASIYNSYTQDKLQKEHLIIARKRNITIIIIIFFIITTIVGIFIIVGKKIIKIKKETQKDFEAKNKALADLKRQLDANPFFTEPICKYILKVVNENSFKAKVNFRIYKDHALTKNQIMMLRDAVDRHYDNFTQRLCKTYPDLTINDIDYCCFYLLGLKDADISALIQRAYPTVYQRSQKLKNIFNTPESLQSAITAMASQLPQNA